MLYRDVVNTDKSVLSKQKGCSNQIEHPFFIVVIYTFSLMQLRNYYTASIILRYSVGEYPETLRKILLK